MKKVFGTAAALLWAASSVHAATITYAGTAMLQGTGFGTTLPILVLSNTPNESGSVLRVGGADVRSGDATPQSMTQPVSALTPLGINQNNLSLLFNIAEPGAGTNVTLQAFTVRFSDNTGTTLFDAVFNQSQVLDQVAGGVGGAGHRFNISLTQAEATQFFSSSTNRMGMLVNTATPILNSAGGPEGFFLIPAPSGGGLVLAGAALLARRRRSR